jgi:hypothetical protein
MVVQWMIEANEPEQTCMVKEFPEYIAWTDAMKEGNHFIGLIEYQRKVPGAEVNILWVMAPNIIEQFDAEKAAVRMLGHIRDISVHGRIIYSDGVAL